MTIDEHEHRIRTLENARQEVEDSLVVMFREDRSAHFRFGSAIASSLLVTDCLRQSRANRTCI